MEKKVLIACLKTYGKLFNKTDQLKLMCVMPFELSLGYVEHIQSFLKLDFYGIRVFCIAKLQLDMPEMSFVIFIIIIKFLFSQRYQILGSRLMSLGVRLFEP